MLSPNLPNFKLRVANNADAQQVQALIFSVLEEYELKPDPDATDMDLFDLQGFYCPPDGYFGVVENSEKRIVATLGLLKLDSVRCELRKMYALPSVRGQGLGRGLLEFAFNLARHWSCARMTLETASVLKEAIGLYQCYGFTPYFPTEITCRCDMAMEKTFIPDSVNETT